MAAAASRHWSVRRESAYYFVSTVLRRLHARRHCRRPWRVKHFLRVGGSKSTTPPPFCLQHKLGIYLSDLMHSLLPSPSVNTAIRLYHAYCPFVRFVYAHIYYIIYTQIYVQCVCFGRVFGLIIPPNIFSVCGNAKSFRSRLF